MSENNTSDQKTEEATPRRLERAFEEGQIAFSSELVSGLMLIVGVLFFLTMGGWFVGMMKDILRERITSFEPMVRHPESILLSIKQHVIQAGVACLALILPVTAVILGGALLQTQFNISSKSLAWNWSRMDPFQGIKRIFSLRSINRGGIAVAKAACIILASYWMTVGRMGEITAAGQSSLENAIDLGTTLVLYVGLLTAVLMTIVGAFDYGFQWWKHRQDLRMTMQEVRDEHKDIEGDPQIKARIRRIANEISKKRMMQAIPKATVVVTNPTHFAVALRYDPEESPAPVVIAKGADFLAEQIIKVAKLNGVAVVERKPVARFLYFNVNVGKTIPAEMFQAVAEIINFIRQLNQRVG
jgi:flagellar biosynthetic protein FlhB